MWQACVMSFLVRCSENYLAILAWTHEVDDHQHQGHQVVLGGVGVFPTCQHGLQNMGRYCMDAMYIHTYSTSDCFIICEFTCTNNYWKVQGNSFILGSAVKHRLSKKCYKALLLKSGVGPPDIAFPVLWLSSLGQTKGVHDGSKIRPASRSIILSSCWTALKCLLSYWKLCISLCWLATLAISNGREAEYDYLVFLPLMLLYCACQFESYQFVKV